MDDALRLMRWTRCVAAPRSGLVSRLVEELQLSERRTRIIEPPAKYMGRTYGETLVVRS